MLLLCQCCRAQIRGQMKRKAYEEAGLSVTQQPSSRLMPAAEAKLGPTNIQNSQVTITATEAMQIKTEKSAGWLYFLLFLSYYLIYYYFLLYTFCFLCKQVRTVLWTQKAPACSYLL